jgi:hypothetical protein
LLRVLACAVAAGYAREREREREREGTRERRKIERDLQKLVALPNSYSHFLFTIQLITSLRQVFVCTLRSKKKKKKTKKKEVVTDCRVLKLWEDADLCSNSHVGTICFPRLSDSGATDYLHLYIHQNPLPQDS